MKRGKFIVLEGIDGSGKTTQARLLEERLQEMGIKVFVTREPGGTKIGEAIRTFAFTHHASPIMDMCLMYSARMLHLVKLIQPALESGMWVVCDRFVSSTWAYQSKIGDRPGVSCSILHEAESSMYESNVPKPDLEIYMALDTHSSAERRRARVGDGDRFEKGLEDVSLGYKNRYSNFEPPYPVHVIDGSSGIARVTNDIMAALIENFLNETHK